MRIFKRILFILPALLMAFASFAQVTTSSITGSIKTNEGLPLEGAAITATHTPCRLAGSLHCGKQKPHQHTDDRDDHQQLNEGETLPSSTIRVHRKLPKLKIVF